MRTHHWLKQVATKGEQWYDWYHKAHTSIVDVANWNDIAIHKLAGVLAVTSPRVQLVRNCKITRNFFEGKQFQSVLGSTRRALFKYLLTGEINGQKTKAFFHCLMGSQDHVVLDTWMAKALKIDQNLFRKAHVRHEATKRVWKTAEILGMSPAECQAAIWSGMFILAGRKPQYLPLKEVWPCGTSLITETTC